MKPGGMQINAHGFGIFIALLARYVLILTQDFNTFMEIIV